MKTLIKIVLSLALLVPTAAHGACSPSSPCTLTDSPEFTANEIYELQTTDPVQGAAIGAAFGGLGVSNEQGQQLANRTSLLNNHRITDEANIAVLQAFDALFLGTMNQNGYMKIPVADSSKGQIQYIVQWGKATWSASDDEQLEGPFSFPIPFPHACEVLVPVTITPEGPSPMSNSNGDGVVMVSAGWLPTTSQFWFWNNTIGGSKGHSAGAFWIAIGY